MLICASLAFAVALVACLLTPTLVHAANPGQLDRSFSGDGKVLTHFSLSGQSVAVDSHGRIVGAGFSGGGESMDLVRLKRNGSFDDSFARDGKRTTTFGGSRNLAYSVAIDSRDRIVVACTTCDFDGCEFAIARYTEHGRRDHSFSGFGKKITSFDKPYNVAKSVVIDSRGRIVVAGMSCVELVPETGCEFALARYKPSGPLNDSFGGGGNGKVTTSVAGSSAAEGAAFDSKGRIVVVGHSGTASTQERFAVARFNRDGSLDRDFSGNGKTTTDLGRGIVAANAVTIDSRDRIVAAGGARRSVAGQFALARYRQDGNLDLSFAGDGTTKTYFGRPGEANDVGVDSKGRIVAVGDVNQMFGMARYNDNGRLDRGFSNGGIQILDMPGGQAPAQSVALRPRNRILVFGGARQFVFARFVGYRR
jgi:uncharacterized delta-60 repeat protein